MLTGKRFHDPNMKRLSHFQTLALWIVEEQGGVLVPGVCGRKRFSVRSSKNASKLE